jgi:hypothetical protein
MDVLYRLPTPLSAYIIKLDQIIGFFQRNVDETSRKCSI